MRKTTGKLLAGAARRDITPAVGTPLSGFIARLSDSTGVADRLHTRALILSAGENSAAIVQMDLLGLGRWHVEEIRAACFRLFGIPPERVLISATHTHSGPGVVPLRGCAMASSDYQWRVIESTIAALRQAWSRRSAASLSAARVPYHLGVNRRQETENGVVLGIAPEKPAPRHLDVLTVEAGGKRHLLFSHAVHPYLLGAENTLISGDLPSLACARLERDHGVALFLNGCAGNIAAEAAFQGLPKAREEARCLAAAVTDAAAKAKPVRALPIAGFTERVHLPYQPLPTTGEIDAMRAQQERTVRPDERTQPAVVARIRAAMDDWATALKAAIAGHAALDPVFCEVQLLRLGEVALVGISGEPFFEIGQKIARKSPFSAIWVLGYCGAYSGYLPTAREFPLGGYEVNDSYRYLGLWQIGPEGGQRVIAAAGKLLQRAAVHSARSGRTGK